jgi:hypothetical protein
VREPDPAASRAELLATYRLRYPDPDAGCRGWDAESLFLVGGLPYVITKTGFPVVYRAATLDPRRTTVLRRVGGLASGVTEPVVFPTAPTWTSPTAAWRSPPTPPWRSTRPASPH